LVFFFPSKSGEFGPFFFIKNPLYRPRLFFSGQNLGKFRPDFFFKWSIYVIFDLLIGILDLVKYLVKYVATTPW